jgi:hypothetical protein
MHCEGWRESQLEAWKPLNKRLCITCWYKKKVCKWIFDFHMINLNIPNNLGTYFHNLFIYKRHLKFKYHVIDSKWININYIITSVTMTYNRAHKVYTFINVDVEAFNDMYFNVNLTFMLKYVVYKNIIYILRYIKYIYHLIKYIFTSSVHQLNDKGMTSSSKILKKCKDYQCRSAYLL